MINVFDDKVILLAGDLGTAVEVYVRRAHCVVACVSCMRGGCVVLGVRSRVVHGPLSPAYFMSHPKHKQHNTQHVHHNDKK
jgi:hypothetical protein